MPVGLLMCAVLHFIGDDDDAARLVNRLVGGLASGSHLALSSGTADFVADIPPEIRARAAEIFKADTDPITPRSAEQITRLLGGLKLVPPGLEAISQCRAED
ncbi:MAG: SAM-dependent methyltransferase, partial [Nocardioides sp.]